MSASGMGYMILEFEFKDKAFAELSGDNIKFWASTGLPTYEGGLDGFEETHGEYFADLLKNKIIKCKHN